MSSLHIVLSIPGIRVASKQCPGCGDISVAPRQRTRTSIVVDANGRPWHAGCALAILGDIPVYVDD